MSDIHNRRRLLVYDLAIYKYCTTILTLVGGDECDCITFAVACCRRPRRALPAASRVTYSSSAKQSTALGTTITVVLQNIRMCTTTTSVPLWHELLTKRRRTIRRRTHYFMCFFKQLYRVLHVLLLASLMLLYARTNPR